MTQAYTTGRSVSQASQVTWTATRFIDGWKVRRTMKVPFLNVCPTWARK